MCLSHEKSSQNVMDSRFFSLMQAEFVELISEEQKVRRNLSSCL